MIGLIFATHTEAKPFLDRSRAMRVGTGLVTLATATSLLPVMAAKLMEATYLPLPESAPSALAAVGSRGLQVRSRVRRSGGS